MSEFNLIHQDLLSYLKGNLWLVQNGYIPKAHAVLCDPPYFLGEMTKRFGKEGSRPAQYGTDGVYQRSSRGFMGKTWDGFESVWQYQEWITQWAGLLMDYVYPGALLMAFGGTRTYHRLAAGLEDAGWTVVDCLSWVYGSGFPKSLSLSKAMGDDHWEGRGTALKPAWEPVVVARAPRGDRTYAGLARDFGTGALNVDGGRIEAESGYTASGRQERYGASAMAYMGGHQSRPWVEERIKAGLPVHVVEPSPFGRWPANFGLVCQCEGEHEPDCPVAMLGAQSGESVSRGGETPYLGSIGGNGIYSGVEGTQAYSHYGDLGTAARFFYTAKAARWEREAGLHARARQKVNDGRQTAIDNPFQRGETKRLNVHPTVKPIQLTEYLARLLLPPTLEEPRRLLVPFAGSGSEVIGGLLAGWDRVTGIEREAEYVALAQSRVGWWAQFASYEAAQRAYGVQRQEAVIAANGGPQQLGLFGDL